MLIASVYKFHRVRYTDKKNMSSLLEHVDNRQLFFQSLQKPIYYLPGVWGLKKSMLC